MTPVASPVIDALDLPDRELEREELLRLVEHVAGRRELWLPHLRLDAAERTYAALHRDSSVDVWAIFWLPENDTGWHDHDTSSGAVSVVEGALEEHALRVAQPERRTRYGAGASFAFGPSHIHRLTCAEPRADLDPRLLAAAVAAGGVLGRRGRRPASDVSSPTPTSCGRSARPRCRSPPDPGT